MKSLFIRSFSYLFGLMIVSFGVTLTILAGLGAGAWDALNVGLAHKTPFSVGNWVIFVGIILIVVNSVLTRSKPILVSLITILIIGYFIDFWLLIVFPNSLINEFFLQVVILLVGVVIMACGASIYMQAKFALIPIDGFMFALRDVLGVKIMAAKTIAEVIALVAAVIVGGPIGLGTIIVTFSIGPLIQWFYPHFEKRLNWEVVQ
ncbi:YczE/YyaS/YitT family protein [Halalkalibacter alkaliphilus]|uniref:Membrane protein n=1 Tax=Halalkalibacter alkaliphilus TaxID=2917993 RepID=A0A9X2I9B7_9BACI|nr:YitT family protein [Halalkalibacter alkaliphilus]MCL7749349.1 membrane protein [Halalkalibacter alkaliphilus]